MKVLVADDNASQRRLLTGLLAQLELETVEAATGAEALDHLLRADGPYVALIDWEMPEMSGVEVVQKVRAAKLELRPHLLLVTARTDRADVVEALRAGADDYLTKPAHPAELRARVEVGRRNVKLQQELQVRITELRDTLRRLDVVGALAAQDPAKGAAERAAVEGALRTELAALDATRALPERFASVVGNLGQSGPSTQRPELWAHVSLVVPKFDAWLDVTLAVPRSLAAAAVKQLSGQPAQNDQALLDCTSDVLTLVMRGFQNQLEGLGIEVLKPLQARAQVGVVPASEVPHRLVLSWGGWTLQVLDAPSQLRETPFVELMPNTMLVRSLTPPALKDVEVLARGTILKPSYLTRAGSFFRGDAAMTEVAVMPVSRFAQDHR